MSPSQTFTSQPSGGRRRASRRGQGGERRLGVRLSIIGRGRGASGPAARPRGEAPAEQERQAGARRGGRGLLSVAAIASKAAVPQGPWTPSYPGRPWPTAPSDHPGRRHRRHPLGALRGAGRLRRLRRSDADIALLAGDLTTHGEPEEAAGPGEACANSAARARGAGQPRLARRAARRDRPCSRRRGHVLERESECSNRAGPRSASSARRASAAASRLPPARLR